MTTETNLTMDTASPPRSFTHQLPSSEGDTAGYLLPEQHTSNLSINILTQELQTDNILQWGLDDSSMMPHYYGGGDMVTGGLSSYNLFNFSLKEKIAYDTKQQWGQLFNCELAPRF